MKPVEGVIAGYDPGGNGHHGLALADVRDGACEVISLHTLYSKAYAQHCLLQWQLSWRRLQ